MNIDSLSSDHPYSQSRCSPPHNQVHVASTWVVRDWSCSRLHKQRQGVTCCSETATATLSTTIASDCVRSALYQAQLIGRKHVTQPCEACARFAGMSIFAKLAGQHGIPVFEIVLVRSAFVAAFAVTKLAHDNEPQEPLLGHRRWLLLVRGMCGFGAGR